MKTDLSFGFNISAKGMSIERRKMNIIAENIANAETTRTSSGEPYKKKFLEVMQNEGVSVASQIVEGKQMPLNVTRNGHISNSPVFVQKAVSDPSGSLGFNEQVDKTPGEMVFMPDHPDANDKGYVQMSNVNVVNEMVDMIAASRGYEANSTALGASKQIAKDSLEI